MTRYIHKPIEAAGHELAYHAAAGVIENGSGCTVGLHSWAALQDLLDERQPALVTAVTFDHLVDPDNPEAALVLAPDSLAHDGDVLSIQWPPVDLAALKASKNAAINAARLRANQTHFTFAGKQIATDPLSRSDIDGAHGDWLTGQAPHGWPGGWKAMDNSYVPIPDQATWFAFYRAMVAQGTTNFMHSQALKAQLAAATTPEEVEAVPVW